MSEAILNILGDCWENSSVPYSQQEIVFRTGIFRKLSLGAPEVTLHNV